MFNQSLTNDICFERNLIGLQLYQYVNIRVQFYLYFLLKILCHPFYCETHHK